jgi:hypothetical protein
MSHWIKESIDSELEVVMSDLNGTEIYRDKAFRAELEVIDGFFEIVKITLVR